MNKDQRQITIEKIFDAIRRCRAGEVSEELAATLEQAGLLRGVMHVGTAPRMRIVFATALKNKWQEAEKHIRSQLPRQASLRYATTFKVDFLVSGQLPDTWADDQIAKRSDLFLDLLEVEVTPVKRYRWKMPKRATSSKNKAKLDPQLADIANFLKENKQLTQLVYDSSKLPSLSCLALITTSGKVENIWDQLDEQDQQPVRDIFKNHGDKARMDTDEIDRDVRASGFAFCEFDSIWLSKENGGFKPAMNQAYEWRRRMVAQNFIEQIRIMPCAVMCESTDYYDELDEINSLMERFKPTVTLSYRPREVDGKEEQLSFPIWNLVICGGSGSGKSVYAYMVASSLLKEHKYDVVYVNYKKSEETEKLSTQPKNEALEFAKVMGHIAQRGISLVTPAEIKNAIAGQPTDEAGAWYTECARDDRVETVLDAIEEGRKGRFQKARRGLFVVIDEILNQKKNLKADMRRVMKFVNQMRTEDSFIGIIHQDLADCWTDDSAGKFIERSTVVLGSGLTNEKDEKCYDSLSSRAGKAPLPVWPVTWTEIKGFQKFQGRFVFLPNKEGNSEHPLRHTIPDYSFLKTREPVPEEWQWGFSTPVVRSH